VSLHSPAECCRHVLAPSLQYDEAPSVGFLPWSRHQPAASSKHGHPKPAPFRPRRFSRPRRLAPPPALRVCFAPQPHPEPALQGVSPRRSRTASSTARTLVSSASGALPFGCPIGATRLRPTSGLALHRDPLRRPQGLTVGAARSPPELFLLQVLLLLAVDAPSRILRPWPWPQVRRVVPAVDLRRITDEKPGSPLSRAPTCSRFPASADLEDLVRARPQRLSSRNHSGPTSLRPAFPEALPLSHPSQELPHFHHSPVTRSLSLVAETRRWWLVRSLLLEDSVGLMGPCQ